MKENSISYKTAKQETERLICEIEEITITHRAYTAECLRRVLKENEELNKYTIHLTDEQYKTVIDLAQNDINQQWIQKVKDKIEELEEELEIMKVDNMYGRYKEYGGKTKWERLFATKYGMHDALQELLEGRKIK